MKYFEICLSNTVSGWHWMLLEDRDGKMHMVEESYRALSTAIEAAKEAQAEIDNPGRTRRLYRKNHWLGLKLLSGIKA